MKEGGGTWQEREGSRGRDKEGGNGNGKEKKTHADPNWEHKSKIEE